VGASKVNSPWKLCMERNNPPTRVIKFHKHLDVKKLSYQPLQVSMHMALLQGCPFHVLGTQMKASRRVLLS
jgi:hypothetical protein